MKELADLYEVMDALMAVSGIDRQTVLDKQTERAEQRSGFNERLQLVWVE